MERDPKTLRQGKIGKGTEKLVQDLSKKENMAEKMAECMEKKMEVSAEKKMEENMEDRVEGKMEKNMDIKMGDKMDKNTTTKIEAKMEKNIKEKTKDNSKIADERSQVEEDLNKEVVQGEKIAEVSKMEVEETEEMEIERARVEHAATQTESRVKCKMVPVVNRSVGPPSNVAVPRSRPPLAAPALNQRPLVLASHVVPSLPLALFEVLVEAIEVATERPVVLLYEPRPDRPVAKEVADIAILPASEDWTDGDLLPVSFSFEHRLNKDHSPAVYADVIVATDRTAHVEDILDLRGYRCSVPDRRKQVGAAALLFEHLYVRGESPSFFGNTLDASTQLAALQMVAGKQAELGVLDSPVIGCHRNSLPGLESVQVLMSLGPLPPYRFMASRSLPAAITEKITAHLLSLHEDQEWRERLAPFGVERFSKNFPEFYRLTTARNVVTSVPYY